MESFPVSDAPEQRPAPVDLIVGANVRRLRKTRGLSQEALADRIGLTFQQVQKYEKGTNRISASKLFDIAAALRCVIDDLFDGAAADGTSPSPETPRDCAELIEARRPGMLARIVRLDSDHLAQLDNIVGWRVQQAPLELAE